MIFQVPLLPRERREGFREEAAFELVLEDRQDLVRNER